jgi:hypothetical protein
MRITAMADMTVEWVKQIKSRHKFDSSAFGLEQVLLCDLALKGLAVKWRPIAEEAKNGSVFDVWMNDERLADVYWGKTEHSCGEDGQHCDSEWHREKPSWVYSALNQRLSGNPTHFIPLSALGEPK